MERCKWIVKPKSWASSDEELDDDAVAGVALMCTKEAGVSDDSNSDNEGNINDSEEELNGVSGGGGHQTNSPTTYPGLPWCPVCF